MPLACQHECLHEDQRILYWQRQGLGGFYGAWIAVTQSTTYQDHRTNLRRLETFHPGAVAYAKNAWLRFKEKIVVYCVDKVFHCRNTTTSRNEGSQAGIKSYLRKSTGDIKHFIDRYVLYLTDQHKLIDGDIAAAKHKPKNNHRHLALSARPAPRPPPRFNSATSMLLTAWM